MPQTYSQLRAGVSAILQDGGISPAGTAANTLFATAELDLFIADALRDIATIVPYVIKVPYTIESRTGTASTTSANNLVDTAEAQFASGDVGKRVYNATDKTWAVITSSSSSTQVGLSKDIFTVNDSYKIFNKECYNNKQINISDVTDYIEVLKAQYPLDTNRNVLTDIGNPDIIELDMTRQPDDSKALTSGTQPETEVLIYFSKRHKVSQLTDLSATVAATCAAAATSLSISALGAGTIEADQEFTIANVGGTYWLKAATAISASTATVSFFPPIESGVASTGVVVTLKQSTLTPKLEPSFVNYVAGKAAISKATYFYQQLNTAVTTLAAATTAIANVAGKIQAATGHIASGSTYTIAATAQIAAATAEIALINAEIDKASTALTAGYGVINTVTVGGGSPEYMGQATSNIGVGRGYLNSGQGYLQSAEADGNVSSHFVQLANGSLNAAAASLNESMGNLRLVSSRLSVAAGGRTLQDWGERKVAQAINELRRLQGVTKSTAYSRR